MSGVVPAWIEDAHVIRLARIIKWLRRSAAWLFFGSIVLIGGGGFLLFWFLLFWLGPLFRNPSLEYVVISTLWILAGTNVLGMALWLISLPLIESRNRRINELSVERARAIIAQGGPKTVEEAVFLIPKACPKCGSSKWVIAKTRGYECDFELAWQSDSAVEFDVWHVVTVVSKSCADCNFVPLPPVIEKAGDEIVSSETVRDIGNREGTTWAKVAERYGPHPRGVWIDTRRSEISIEQVYSPYAS